MDPSNNESESEPGWEVRHGRSPEEIVVVFRGHVDEETGTAAALAVVRALPDGEFHLVFDVVDVSAYQARARHAWQRELWPLRKRILSITVISNSALTSMGARVFSLAMGIRCTIVPGSGRTQFFEAMGRNRAN